MAYVKIGSDLKRKKWMREGLVQAKSKSFWAPFTGTTGDSIVVQVNNTNASEGHTVVFDYDGNLAGKAIKGKDTAFGKGEQKKKFSNLLTVDRYRFVVDNGDAFDAVDIGDLSLSQHADSRAKLGDLFIRAKDQFIFDAVQGANGQPASHVINLGTTFDYNALIEIETKVKTASGFSTGAALPRSPLYPFRTADGRPMWLFVVDSFMAAKIKMSNGYQAMVYNADVRGNENRAIKGIIGKIGSLLIAEADVFFGSSAVNTVANGFGVIGMQDVEVEIAGLRRYDEAGRWTGQDGFNGAASQDLTSRGVILGANAVQIGFGKMPDYKFQESQDFGIKSESALEVWMEVQKARLLAETDDYKMARVGGYDFGVIAVDLQTQTGV